LKQQKHGQDVNMLSSCSLLLLISVKVKATLS